MQEAEGISKLFLPSLKEGASELEKRVNYEEPLNISPVSGVPHDWKRSGYIRKQGVGELFVDLIEHTKAKIILLSYSNEGTIPREELEETLEKFGTFETLEQSHRRYSSTDQSSSSKKVIERLYVIQKR